MEIIRTLVQLREYLKDESCIAFVPTMGGLHAGHMELTRIAREHLEKIQHADESDGGCVVVSIFVNRLQFGPNEDFGKYPRTLSADCDKCLVADVNVVFVPDESVLYPEPQTYLVEPPEIQNILEGAVRPGHYRGVATVVLKLFNMVQPQIAVFGKKDYQQCRVLDNMVRQLNLPIEMVLAETVRAADGLALSSRNSYLNATARVEAPQLNAVLRGIESAMRKGGRDFAVLEENAMDLLKQRGWQPDYVAIRRQADLMLPSVNDRSLVVLTAARLDTTRLIDNVEVSM